MAESALPLAAEEKDVARGPEGLGGTGTGWLGVSFVGRLLRRDRPRNVVLCFEGPLLLRVFELTHLSQNRGTPKTVVASLFPVVSSNVHSTHSEMFNA